MKSADQVEDFRKRLDTSLDHYRAQLEASFDGLSEEEARRSLVPSRTTVLGLVKHMTYVETFYFQHSITGQALTELGVATTPDRSFVLTKKDSIATVREGYQATCETSRQATADLALDDTVTGRVEQPVLTLYLRNLHDLIQHCGHADILREQILATR